MLTQRLEYRQLIFVALFSIIVLPVFSQTTTDNDTVPVKNNVWVEIAGYGATTDRTPFWLQTNEWGIVPTSGQAGSLRVGWLGTNPFPKKVNGIESEWKFIHGLEMAGNLAKNSKLLIPQAYAGVTFKKWELYVGRRKQWVGLNDYALGTGSYMWSGNALPIPKIQIGTTQYIKVPFTSGYLYFKGFYSDGMFEGNRPVTNDLLLHNKALFLRFGKPNGKFKLHGGFNHAVQWGGRTPYNTVDGRMPHGFKNYWYVISGLKPGGKLDNASTFDNTNRVGNHVASLDAALEFDLENVNLFFYRQNLIEDRSLFYLNNIKDGLNGIRIQRKHPSANVFSVSTAVFELLYTKSQGGSKVEDGNRRGNDDYFNNAQVRDGWSYYGRAIGTPFITPTNTNLLPLYADFFTNNNRVWVLHSGLSGKLSKLTWSSKLSYSSNQGTYAEPFSKKVYQFSGLISLQADTKWLGGSVVKGSVSMDSGDLYENSLGIMLSVRKTIFQN